MKPREIINFRQQDLLLTLKKIQSQLQYDQILNDQTIDMSDENKVAVQLSKAKYDFLTRVTREYNFKSQSINSKLIN